MHTYIMIVASFIIPNICVCMSASMHLCICVCLCAFMCVCVCVRAHVCVYEQTSGAHTIAQGHGTTTWGY